MLRASLFLIALSPAAGAVDAPAAPAALFSSCARSEQTGVLPAAASVKVTSSIAGDEGTCFRVSGSVDGQPVNGAIFDSAHPAAIAYREALARPVPPAPPTAPAPPAPLAPAASPAPVRPARFENLTGANLHDGERFELGRLHSKLVLVHFWDSANDSTAQKDAEFLSHLRAQYADKGLEVVGITTEKNRDRVRTFNDNAEAVWPLLQDRGKLAEKYGVTTSSEIFVLDGQRNIVSAGPKTSGLEQLVGERLSRR